MIFDRSPRLAFWLIWLCLCAASCSAEEPPHSARETSAQASPVPAMPDLPVVDAKNILELRERVGQDLIVSGEVSRIGKSNSGHRFLNFTGNPELSVFISADDLSNFQADLPEKLYEGRFLAVTSRLERFNGKLQLRVRSPDAIKLTEQSRESPARSPQQRPSTIELKSIGSNQWISPAGLRYAGRDAEGNTRRDHVLRHARDIPQRDGPHGVFDGGEELTFAWIDLAWQKIQREKIKPESEPGREVYTVNMGQRVGFLGGRTGARENHPALKRIFLVLQEGTTNVITAFPK